MIYRYVYDFFNHSFADHPVRKHSGSRKMMSQSFISPPLLCTNSSKGVASVHLAKLVKEIVDLHKSIKGY